MIGMFGSSRRQGEGFVRGDLPGLTGIVVKQAVTLVEYPAILAF